MGRKCDAGCWVPKVDHNPKPSWVLVLSVYAVGLTIGDGKAIANGMCKIKWGLDGIKNRLPTATSIRQKLEGANPMRFAAVIISFLSLGRYISCKSDLRQVRA